METIFAGIILSSISKTLLVSRGIKVQDDVLTKEEINAKCMRWGSYFFGKISSAVVMYSYKIPGN